MLSLVIQFTVIKLSIQDVQDLLPERRAVREGGQQGGALGDPRGRERLPGGAHANREVGGNGGNVLPREEGLRT